MIRALFRGLFLEGRDIGEPAELIEIAGTVGLEPQEVTDFLAGERHHDAVLGGHRRAERLGIRGVPVFVVDERHVIAGAQPPEVLVGLLDIAASAPAAAAVS
jgi:predicted DsbA family dithiol-disulfide isomerase